MKPIPFEKATFMLSLLPQSSFASIKNSHGKELNEIALVGKSNVGKSSLINCLFKSKHLAKVSGTPGKTQQINFFNVDEQICLVDLPGYGFAEVPKNLKDEWSKSLDLYLRTRQQLKLLIVLLDIRRTASEDDLMLLRWAESYNKPFFVVFTKTDKLSAAELKHQIDVNLSFIHKAIGKDVVYIPFTIQSGRSRELLVRTIQEFLHNV